MMARKRYRAEEIICLYEPLILKWQRGTSKLALGLRTLDLSSGRAMPRHPSA